MPDDHNRRGLSLCDKANAAHLAQRETWNKGRQIVEELHTQTTAHQNHLKELEQVNSMIDKTTDEETLEFHNDWRTSIFHNLNRIRKRRMGLERMSEEHRQAGTSKEVTECLNEAVKVKPEEVVVEESTNDASGLTSANVDADEDDDEIEVLMGPVVPKRRKLT